MSNKTTQGIHLTEADARTAARDMPVSPDYTPRENAFTGTIKWVQIDIDAAAKDVDHRIGAEERFQLAMARQ